MKDVWKIALGICLALLLLVGFCCGGILILPMIGQASKNANPETQSR